MQIMDRHATYRDIGGPDGYLAREVPFSGSSMSAQTDSDGTYRVYSYATEIASVTQDGSRRLNVTKYSSTTSRQQTLCAAWLRAAESTDYEGPDA